MVFTVHIDMLELGNTASWLRVEIEHQLNISKTIEAE